MKTLICLFLFVLLLPLAIASECDDLCLEKNYDFGTCRATIEDGFCNGNNAEIVLGFSTCENYERCCCGNVDAIVEGTEDPESSVDIGKSVASFFENQGGVYEIAENFFWILLLIVAIMALAVVIKKRSSKKEEIKV